MFVSKYLIKRMFESVNIVNKNNNRMSKFNFCVNLVILKIDQNNCYFRPSKKR